MAAAWSKNTATTKALTIERRHLRPGHPSALRRFVGSAGGRMASVGLSGLIVKQRAGVEFALLFEPPHQMAGYLLALSFGPVDESV
jgi:hypothetical protein